MTTSLVLPEVMEKLGSMTRVELGEETLTEDGIGNKGAALAVSATARHRRRKPKGMAWRATVT